MGAKEGRSKSPGNRGKKHDSASKGKKEDSIKAKEMKKLPDDDNEELLMKKTKNFSSDVCESGSDNSTSEESESEDESKSSDAEDSGESSSDSEESNNEEDQPAMRGKFFSDENSKWLKPKKEKLLSSDGRRI